MPAVTSGPDMNPLATYEPLTPFAASSAAIPRQERPTGQLSLGLWTEPAHAQVEPPAGIDRDKLVGVLTALVEVYDGSRPVTQLRKALHPCVYQELVARRRPTDRRYTLRTTHIRHPHSRVIEACGLVHSGKRALAMCARFDEGEHGWLCTEFTIMRPGHTRQGNPT